MTKDIQRAILRACAEFIKRKLEPLEKRLSDIETKTIGVIEQKAAPIVSRVEQLEARQLQKGDQGEPGPAGKDADPIVVADVVSELLATEGLSTLVDLQVAEGIAKYFEANPVQHGRDGAKGDTGDCGEAGTKGEPGADGVGLAGAMIDRDGNLIVTKTNGEAIALGCVVGKDGTAGKDGADGFGFDDMDVEYDGERTFTIKLQRGSVVKTKSFHVPTVIDRGYWREGTKAEAGDAMTHDGTLWIATKATSAKPCRESDDWRIGARRGRDGLQGPPGKAYEPPQPIKLAGSQ